ncbi:hypothetical protein [Actinomadura hibisca]|uniref:hypothetical protein n=1 Tax=Actinomadura hibisca TaxID=68565 RepID=UPI00083536C7|nr:hypothetical protein [Actinomadura hibisca]
MTDDPAWRYRSPALAGGGMAHLRVWDASQDRPPGSRLVIVTDVGQGASIANSVEDIYTVLTAAYGPLVVLEHGMPDGAGEPVEYLDQVVIADGAPRWRRVWPAPDVGHERWMREHGHALLAAYAGRTGGGDGADD